MSEPATKNIATDNTVQLDLHAAATLQYIRASMEAASSLRVPGSAAIAVGVVGVLATAVSLLPSMQDDWMLVWFAAALLAISVGGTLLLQQFAPAGVGPIFARGPVRRFLVCWSPAMFAGAAMTAVLWRSGNHEAISGTWLLLYGCSLVSSCAVTDKGMGLLGVGFFALGVVTFLLPPDYHVYLLGAGFGGLHLGFGFSTRQAAHGN